MTVIKQLITTILLFGVFANAQAAPLNATRSDDFVNSIGVVSNMVNDSYYPDDASFWLLLKGRILDLGIRHIRDTTGYSGSALVQYANRLAELSANGIDFTLSVHPDDFSQLGNEDPSINAPDGLINKISAFMVGGRVGTRDLAGGVALRAIKSINEKDHVASYLTQCVTPGNITVSIPADATWIEKKTLCDPQWRSNLMWYNQTLHDALALNSVTANLLLIGPPLVHVEAYQTTTAPGGTTNLWNELQPMRNYFDRSSMNLYCWRKGQYHCFASTAAIRAQLFSPRPLVATEYGYFTEPQTNQNAVSESVQAKVLLRAIGDHYLRNPGDVHFIYSLKDSGTFAPTQVEGSFGIMKQNADPKPAYTAIKNLIALLKDPGPSFAPGGLEMTISNSNSALHQVVLARRDGTYRVLLWNETSALPVSTDAFQNITLSFPQPVNIDLIDPRLGQNATYSYRSTISQVIPVPDSVIVLSISNTPPTPTPTPTASNTSTATVTPTPTITFIPSVTPTVTPPGPNSPGGSSTATPTPPHTGSICIASIKLKRAGSAFKASINVSLDDQPLLTDYTLARLSKLRSTNIKVGSTNQSGIAKLKLKALGGARLQVSADGGNCRSKIIKVPRH